MFYLVGGAVRDLQMGMQPKDLDYACEAPSYEAMRDEIVRRGGKIFLETPEFFTIRAKVDGLGAADFVLCRKDGEYKDSRHPDHVEVGTLYDDLARRDFTVNAMALDENNNLIDYFNGLKHLAERRLVCVGNARQRFNEDALRLLRAVRFSITKHLTLDAEIAECLRDPRMMNTLRYVSIERVRDELYKAFTYNTPAMLVMMANFPLLTTVFRCGLHLEPSLKDR